MKKVIMFVCASLVVTTFAFSQVHVQPKIGLNSYKLQSEVDGFEFQSKSGFNIGIDFRIGEHFYITPGIHYFALDADFEGIKEDIGNAPIMDNVKQEVLRTPVYIGFPLIDVGKFKLRVQGGGIASMPLNINENDFGFGKDDFEKVRFSAGAGAGLDLGRLTFDVNYEWGLKEVFDVAGISAKERIVTASIGWLF